MNQQRAARTRSMIQLGGLLVRSGITEKLGIKIGADLQRVEDQKNKAYTLLGLLVGQVSVPKELEKYEILGKQFLFENHDNNVNQEMLEISENLITD
jgi:hypothetical protein